MTGKTELHKKKWTLDSTGWRVVFAFTAFGSCLPGLLILLIGRIISFVKRPGIARNNPTNPLVRLVNILFITLLGIMFAGGIVSSKPGIALPLTLGYAIIIWVFVFGGQSLGWKKALLEENYLRILTVAGALACLISLARLYLNYIPRTENVFSGINGFGTTLILICGLVVGYMNTLGGVKRYWLLPYLGLTIWALLATQSRGAWYGFALMFFSFSLVNRKMVIYALIIIIIAGLAVSFSPTLKDRLLNSLNPQQHSNSERVVIWETSLKIIRDHPLFGIGTGVFPIVYDKYIGTRYDESFRHKAFAHNLFLQVAAEFGLIGLAVFVGIIGITIFMAFSIARTGNPIYQALFAVLIGVLVHQQVDIPIWGMDIGGSFWMLVGIIIGSYQYEKTKGTVTNSELSPQ